MVNLFKLRLQPDYLLFLLKRNARYMFIMSVAMLTLYPVLGITVNILTRSSNYDGIREVGLFFNMSLLLLTSFLIPLQIHGYMNSKKNLDVYHALPIKRQDLFITSMVASLVIIAIPFTIGWFSGGILTLSAKFTFGIVLARYVALLAVSSAIVSLVLFTMMNTGTALDAFLYAMTLNFLPLLAWGAYILFVQTILLGFTIGDLAKYIPHIFPIWALYDVGFAVKTGWMTNAWLIAGYWILISIVLLIVADLFYLKRKSEKAEKPFTNKTFFPVVSGLVVILFIIFLYCVIYNMNSSLFYTSYYHPVNFIFPIFFSVVLYLVMDAIAERGFKHLGKAFLHYLVIAAVALSLLLGGLWTRGFGYASKIPALNDVESIDLVYTDYLNLVLSGPDAYRDYGSGSSSVVLNLTSADDIKAVHDLHQVILSEYKWIDYNYNKGNNTELIKLIEGRPGYVKSYTPLPFTVDNQYSASATVKITYHLKDGSTLQRDYSIPTQWTSSLLALANSDQIIKLSAPNLALLDAYPKLTSATWSTPLSSTLLNSVTNLDLNALKSAYLSDLANLSDAQAISTEYRAYGSLTMTTCNQTGNQCFSSALDVDERFPSVMAVLSASGINLTPEFNQEARAALVIPTMGSALVNDSPLFRVALAVSSGRYMADMTMNLESQGNVTYTYVPLTHDEVKLILPYLTQKGISNVPLMSLVIEGVTGNLLVQAQYADEVNAIIAGKTLETTNNLYGIFNPSIPTK